jgi:hypothetical protein
MIIAREWYAAKAEAGLYKSSAAETAAALRHICGFGLSADQELFTVFAGLELCAEPERHAAASGPDLVGILGTTVLHRHAADLPRPRRVPLPLPLR